MELEEANITIKVGKIVVNIIKPSFSISDNAEKKQLAKYFYKLAEMLENKAL